MTGYVNERLEARIQASVVDQAGGRHIFDAVIDTGYDGHLTLPLSAIKELGYRKLRVGQAVLADGSDIFFDVYGGALVWEGKLTRIPIDAAETEPLAGTQLLKGLTLTVTFVPGVSLKIERPANS